LLLSEIELHVTVTADAGTVEVQPLKFVEPACTFSVQDSDAALDVVK